MSVSHIPLLGHLRTRRAGGGYIPTYSIIIIIIIIIIIVLIPLCCCQGAELRLQNAAGRLCAAAASDNLYELQRLVENGISCNTGTDS
jgi:hypothetical protein